MTAVEYIREKLLGDEYWYEDMTFDQIIAKAKEMEKEQIKNAWDDGQSDGATICTQKADNPSEEYYNKTFKSE